MNCLGLATLIIVLTRSRRLCLGNLSVGPSPTDLSGSQKCRRPHYLLTLVGKHSNLGKDSVVVFREKFTLKYFSAFLPRLGGSADRVYQKKKVDKRFYFS